MFQVIKDPEDECVICGQHRSIMIKYTAIYNNERIIRWICAFCGNGITSALNEVKK